MRVNSFSNNVNISTLPLLCMNNGVIKLMIHPHHPKTKNIGILIICPTEYRELLKSIIGGK